MKQSKIFLQPLQRRLLYSSVLLLWLSGGLWLYYKYFGQVQGDYGIQAHPAQPILLEIHGAVAMIFSMVFGTLLDQHVPVGWKQKRQRPSGVSLLGICALLIISGWGLYYIGNAGIRHWTSLFHSIVGLALPAIIYLHIWLGRRSGKSAP